MTPSVPKRRWFQFSLRTLLLLTALLGLVLGLWTSYGAQRRAASALQGLGARLTVRPARPAWLRRVVGEANFVNVTVCDLSRTGVKDADLQHLTRLTRLRKLSLFRTRVTDAGLAHLRGLTQLRTIVLIDLKVTDAGLLDLEGLTNLQALWLSGTQVTDAGVADLRKALPNVRIVR